MPHLNSLFHYTHAIVRKVPNSLKNKALGALNGIHLDKAKQQHDIYCRALEKANLDVIKLPADETLPDCVFVEDTCVVCDGVALICNLHHPSRKKEVEIIKEVFKNQLHIPVIEILDKEATIEGGDVLFTGREFFAGISPRTNEAGVKALATAFPEYSVTAIEVSHEIHLKTSLSMAGPNLICAGASKGVQDLIKNIEKQAKYKYQTLVVPDDEAANCVYANGNLIHRADFLNSLKIFEREVRHKSLPVKTSQFAKAQGRLTCLSVLIKQNNHVLNDNAATPL